MASVVLAFRGIVARFLMPLSAVVSFTRWGYWMRPHPVVNRRLALRVRPFVAVSAANRAMLFIPRVVRNDFDPDSQPVMDRNPTSKALLLLILD